MCAKEVKSIKCAGQWVSRTKAGQHLFRLLHQNVCTLFIFTAKNVDLIIMFMYQQLQISALRSTLAHPFSFYFISQLIIKFLTIKSEAERDKVEMCDVRMKINL